MKTVIHDDKRFTYQALIILSQRKNAYISSAVKNVMLHFLFAVAWPTGWALRQNKKKILVPLVLDEVYTCLGWQDLISL